MLQAQLGQVTEVEWVEREQLRLAEQELHLSEMSLMAGRDGVRRGKWVKADWLVQGRFAFDDAGHRTLELQLLDLHHADLLANKSVPLGASERIEISPGMLGLASAALREMLAEAERRAEKKAGQIIIAPLFFTDVSDWWRQNLRPLEKEFHDYLALAAATNRGVRLARYSKAYQSLDEMALATDGWVENGPQGWQKLADVYLWGTCSITNAARVARTNSESRIRLTLNLWNGEGEPKEYLQRFSVPANQALPMRAIVARFDRMLENALSLARAGAYANETDLVRKRIAASLLADVEAMSPTHGRRLDGMAHSEEDRQRFADAVRMLEAACLFDPDNAVAQARRVSTRWGWWIDWQGRVKSKFWSQWRRSEEWGKYAERFGLESVIEMPFPYTHEGIPGAYRKSIEDVLGMFETYNREQAYGFPAGVPKEVEAVWKAQLESEAQRRRKNAEEAIAKYGHYPKSRFTRKPAATVVTNATAPVAKPVPAVTNGTVAATKPAPPVTKSTPAPTKALPTTTIPATRKPVRPAKQMQSIPPPGKPRPAPWQNHIPPMFNVPSPRVLPRELQPQIEPISFPARAEATAVHELIRFDGRLWVVAEDGRAGGINAPKPDIAEEMDVEATRIWSCGEDDVNLEPVPDAGFPNRITRIVPQGSALWLVGASVARFQPRENSITKFGAREGFDLSNISSITAADDGRVFAVGDAFKILSLAADARIWEALPIRPVGSMSAGTGNPLRISAQGSQLLMVAGSVFLYDRDASAWTNFNHALGSVLCVAPDQTGFWIGRREGLALLEMKARAIHDFRLGSFRSWQAPRELVFPRNFVGGMQIGYGQIPPVGKLKPLEETIAKAFKTLQASREAAHTNRASIGRTIDPLELSTRLPGPVRALAHDGEILWLGCENAGDTLVCALHKPSRSWIGQVEFKGQLASLAASERYIWVGFKRGDQLLVRFDKRTFTAVPRESWQPDPVTEAELGRLIRKLPPRGQTLHAFFSGDYATAVRLLESEPGRKRDLEALFLLAFSHDVLGLDKPDAARRYFEEIVEFAPDSPWAEVAREAISDNDLRHSQKSLAAAALEKFDRNHDGVLDEAEQRALSKDPAHQRESEAVAARQTETEIAGIVKRFDTDEDAGLSLPELERLHRLVRVYLSARTEAPAVASRGQWLQPLLFEEIPTPADMLKRHDRDGDQTLDAAELTELSAELRRNQK